VTPEGTTIGALPIRDIFAYFSLTGQPAYRPRLMYQGNEKFETKKSKSQSKPKHHY
jgi:hypothetical protein